MVKRRERAYLPSEKALRLSAAAEKYGGIDHHVVSSCRAGGRRSHLEWETVRVVEGFGQPADIKQAGI